MTTPAARRATATARILEISAPSPAAPATPAVPAHISRWQGAVRELCAQIWQAGRESAATARAGAASTSTSTSRPDGTDGHFHPGPGHPAMLSHDGHPPHYHDPSGRTHWDTSHHTAMAAHDGFAAHSHEVRPDHLAVPAARRTPLTPPAAASRDDGMREWWEE